MKLFTLNVMNLPSTTTEDDMRHLVNPIPDYIHVPLHRDTGKGRGWALVSFKDKRDARRAYKYMKDMVYKGRQLSVMYEEEKVKEGSSKSSSRSPLNRYGGGQVSLICL